MIGFPPRPFILWICALCYSPQPLALWFDCSSGSTIHLLLTPFHCGHLHGSFLAESVVFFLQITLVGRVEHRQVSLTSSHLDHIGAFWWGSFSNCPDSRGGSSVLDSLPSVITFPRGNGGRSSNRNDSKWHAGIELLTLPANLP